MFQEDELIPAVLHLAMALFQKIAAQLHAPVHNELADHLFLSLAMASNALEGHLERFLYMPFVDDEHEHDA